MENMSADKGARRLNGEYENEQLSMENTCADKGARRLNGEYEK